MVLPTVYGPVEVATLTTDSAGPGVNVIVSVSVTGVGVSFDTAEPVLTKLPESNSACVTVWVPVKVQVASGASVAQVVLLGVRSGSLSTTLFRFTLPLLVAVTV